MKKSEAQQTIRFYDAELTRTLNDFFSQNKNEYRNKNDFYTELIKCGMEQKNRKKTAEDETGTFDDVSSLASKIFSELKTTTELLITQLKSLYVHEIVIEKLCSSIYFQLQEMNPDDRATIRNADAGIFDELPERFEKIIDKLKDI